MLGDRRVLVRNPRAHMARDAFALVEQLDRRVGETRVDGLAQQLERYRVVMLVDLDVIVGGDGAALPLGIAVALTRQPLQHRSIEAREQSDPALLQALHHMGVDCRYAVTDSVVQLHEREEAAIAQLAQHEALDDADGRLVPIALSRGFLTRAGNTT